MSAGFRVRHRARPMGTSAERESRWQLRVLGLGKVPGLAPGFIGDRLRCDDCLENYCAVARFGCTSRPFEQRQRVHNLGSGEWPEDGDAVRAQRFRFLRRVESSRNEPGLVWDARKGYLHREIELGTAVV